jgi:putative nucleotidyltransferase with HDIG domain
LSLETPGASNAQAAKAASPTANDPFIEDRAAAIGSSTRGEDGGTLTAAVCHSDWIAHNGGTAEKRISLAKRGARRSCSGSGLPKIAGPVPSRAAAAAISRDGDSLRLGGAVIRDLWKRWTSRSTRTRETPPAEAQPNDVTRLSQDATGGEAASAPADAAPAEGAPRPALPRSAQPVEATESSLQRSLRWRFKVLLDRATREELQSDGPKIASHICSQDSNLVRQPPTAVQEALRVARNPMSSYGQVLELFERDPALAPALLKHANSAFYRREGPPIVSLHDAAHRVGMTGIDAVLTSAMVGGLLCKPGGAYDAYVQKVWSHMRCTAPLARQLAPAFGVDPEKAWVYALLHDVGKLIVFDHLSTLRQEWRREVKIPPSYFHQLLAHVHEPLGGLAVLKWNLGGEAARVVSEHHRHVSPPTHDPFAELIHVAEALDIAHANHREFDWEKVWTDGAIHTDRAAVERLLPEWEPRE